MSTGCDDAVGGLYGSDAEDQSKKIRLGDYAMKIRYLDEPCQFSATDDVKNRGSAFERLICN